MFELLVLVGLGWLGWKLTRHFFSFPGQFAGLLEAPRRRGTLLGPLSSRSEITGWFKGRMVTLLYQRREEYQLGFLVVALRAAAPDQSVIQLPTDTRARNPEVERALYALEATYELRLQMQDGWLQATWAPVGFFIFPGRFEPARWKAVLEHLTVIAAHLERPVGAPASGPEPDTGVPGAPPSGGQTAAAGQPAFDGRGAFTSDPHAAEPPPDDLPYADPFADRRPAIHRGLFITRATGVLCAIGGFSMLTAMIPFVLMSRPPGRFSWTAGLVGVTWLATGLATVLVSTRSVPALEGAWQAPPGDGRTPLGGWLWLLAAALVLLPLWMIGRLVPLIALWLDMLAFLDAQDVWSMLESGQELSGIVAIPVFGVLSVPVFGMAVAISVVIHALLLFTMLVMARPRFPRAFLAFVVLHVGLAISMQLGVSAALSAGQLVESALEDSPEREEASAAIARYGQVLEGSSRILAVTIAGLAVWTPGLFLSRRVPATFAGAN